MIYTLEQIKELVEPIAKKYKLKALWVFGSYARGEATVESDIDLLMDYTDSTIVNIFDLYDINKDLSEKIKLNVDLISTDGLFNPANQRQNTKFIATVCKERVLIYEQ
jgi:predicted nucleotidyltransferase